MLPKKKNYSTVFWKVSKNSNKNSGNNDKQIDFNYPRNK